MKYLDFQKSALRHLESCYHILEHIDNSVASNKKIKSDRLLINVYYLSGYVIECSMKFAFFKAIRFKKEDEINELDYNDGSYEYSFTDNKKRCLQTHKLEVLRRYLSSVDRSLPHNIPFVTLSALDKTYDAMIKKWDSTIRYSLEDYARLETSIEHSLVKQYLDDVVKPIFDSLTRR